MTTCLNCGGGSPCDCFLVGGGLVTVAGVGSDASPYIVGLTCNAILGCVGAALANVGFHYASGAIIAEGLTGDVLTATGSGAATWVTP